METPYHPERAEFSNRAHQAARRLIYPQIFKKPFDELEFDEGTLLAMGERGQALDGEMAIDRIVKVPIENFRDPLRFTVQERFREKKWAHKKDVTITEWNERTNSPSELYKIAADLFVYGYFNEDQCDFIDIIAFWVGPVKRGLIDGSLPFKWGYQPAKQQPFLILEFVDLISCSLWWKCAPEDSDLGDTPYPPTDEIRVWQNEQIERHLARKEKREKEKEKLKKLRVPGPDVEIDR